MITVDDLYSNRVILNSVLPLFKVLVESKPELARGFAGKNAVVQFSAVNGEDKTATHFVIKNGVWTVVLGTTEKPEVEFEFKSISDFNNFFKGKSLKLPKIKGLRHLGIVIPTFKTLLTLSKVMGAKITPESEEEKDLLVKMFFYLLTSGISQLNKAGHPVISNWVAKSPDCPRIFG
jgi:hypothetical protein